MHKSVFRKTMLRVGTYHSPDGRVDVTPERLRHWSNEFQRMKQARQVIPMHWDHGSDLESLSPIPADKFRSAKNTVGRLAGFKLAPDGKAAEVLFETLDPVATKKVATNAVYVSPVIMPQWRDGAGNVYRDSITSMDLVNHPVDHSQSPARPAAPTAVIACALRMSASPVPYRLSTMAAPTKPTKPKDDELDSDFLEGEDEGEIDLDSEADLDLGEGDDAGMPDPPMDPETSPADVGPETPAGVGAAEMLVALADIGIVLPSDTTDANFMDRLRTALIAKKGAGTADPMDPMQQPENQFGNNGLDVQMADPAIQTMSAAQRFAQDSYRKDLQRRLDYLLKTGRCTPAEHREGMEQIGTVKLSLTTSGRPRNTTLAAWLRARETVRAGSQWEPGSKIAKLSAAAEPRKTWKTTRSGKDMDPEALQAAVDALS
jgi:hypothetical protein